MNQDLALCIYFYPRHICVCNLPKFWLALTSLLPMPNLALEDMTLPRWVKLWTHFHLCWVNRQGTGNTFDLVHADKDGICFNLNLHAKKSCDFCWRAASEWATTVLSTPTLWAWRHFRLPFFVYWCTCSWYLALT